MQRNDLVEGMAVYSADGTKLGKIIELGASQFQIEKGIFFPKDYVARYDDIQDVREGAVYLALAQDGLRQAGEAEEMNENNAATPAWASGATPGMGTDRWPRGREEEEVRIPVSEEELEATKRQREAGAVRVAKRVVEEQRELTVPVMKEEVRVERVPASGATAQTAELKDDVVSVPVREEEVEIRKRPVVREEVRLKKDRRVEEQRFADSVKKEEVNVDNEGETRAVPSSDDPLTRR
jgi:uncharacterized protein (TIGR02271 family)